MAVGIASIYLNKEKILGIDFRGGEESIVSFGEMIDAGDLDETFAAATEIGEVQHVYRSEVGSGEEASRLVLQTEVGKGREVISLLQSKFPSANLVEQGLSNIGASVSDQITNDAISSVLVALIGILLYVAIRFEMGYAIGAVVATVHDVLMTIGLFVLLGTISGGTLAPVNSLPR